MENLSRTPLLHPQVPSFLGILGGKLASRYEEDAVTELTLIYPDLSPSSTAGKFVGGYHLLELSMDL